MTGENNMIKMQIPCKCGGILKRHHSYKGKIYWYCSKCNSRYDGDEPFKKKVI